MAALGKKLSESEEKLWMANVDLERLFEAEEEFHMLKEWSAFKDEVIAGTNQEIASRKRKELTAKLKEQNAKLKEHTAKLKEQLAKDEEQFAKAEEQFAKAEEQLAKDKERLAKYKASLDKQIARANKEHAKLKEQRMLLDREKAKEQVELEVPVVPVPTTSPPQEHHSDVSDSSSESDDVSVPEAVAPTQSIATSRPRREIRKPARYDGMVAYALPVITGIIWLKFVVHGTDALRGWDWKGISRVIQAGPPFLSSVQRTQPGLTVGEAAASSPATPTTPPPVKTPLFSMNKRPLILSAD
ncbi:hypothetical protein RHGRI_025229 [Rhododendron griersonianum]|uniref:NUDE domain-containing protein n=1 Tax=Rhododendron griersonianum TaxID=479676 RepID=A0AAV6JF95_9ERIC|nr:hypothetical protein RHGRI_025229 [Rhododendron griersonianum]